LQFLVLALWRLRRAASIAKGDSSIRDAIRGFDQGLPGLRVMRDIGEHIEAYAVDSPGRRYLDKTRGMIEMGEWRDPIYEWMGETLNVDEARSHAIDLFVAIRDRLRKC